MKISKWQFIVAVVALVIVVGVIVWRNYIPAIRPAFFPPPTDITQTLPPTDTVPEGAVNETNMPLKLPDGFSISIFAKNLPGARVMAFDQFGNMWVTRTTAGAITKLEIGEDGNVKHQGDALRGFKNPHGLAFDPNHPGLAYIAEENKITRTTLTADDPGQDVLTLPSGGGHFTRTIGFGPDKKLYISIGSSCNVCIESDDNRAVILQYDPVTQKSEVFAKGLRNSVFFTWQAITNKLFAADMGRDNLGDNTPPDEINVIEQGKNYGWPNCYGENIHDTNFDKNTYIRNPCMEPFETLSLIDIPAHSAPLGLAFIPTNSQWPKEYWGNLLVAYHGSWNRSSPTGYKVVRMIFDANGAYVRTEDFITGWLTPQGALGRPVDILVKSDGTMYLSDDKAGVIYKIKISK